jgi:hypothetical protein
VVRLIADPVPPYHGWHDTALIFAGSDAWAAAKPTRDAGRRAVTLCPPEAHPSAIKWPSVAYWLGDVGDIDLNSAIDLGRLLIDHGAIRVTLVGEMIPKALVLRRRVAE